MNTISSWTRFKLYQLLFFSELSVQSFYGVRNSRLRSREDAAALTVDALDSDEDTEMSDDSFNDPEFRPSSPDGKNINNFISLLVMC